MKNPDKVELEEIYHKSGFIKTLNTINSNLKTLRQVSVPSQTEVSNKNLSNFQNKSKAIFD